ncbi:MAG TPA: hypothetical protein V6C72_16685, partial [Chroococcales cyanobacterium]
LPFLKNALAGGSTSEKADAAVDVGSDALMIGGAVASLVPAWRGPATAVEFAGSLLKLGNQAFAFRKYS